MLMKYRSYVEMYITKSVVYFPTRKYENYVEMQGNFKKDTGWVVRQHNGPSRQRESLPSVLIDL